MLARRPNPAILAVVLCCIYAQVATAASTCNVFGCVKCDPEDPDVCTQCKKGYAVDTESGACGCAVGYGTTMSAAGRLIKAPRSFPADCDAPDGPKPARTTCRCRRCPPGTTSTGGPVEATTQCVPGAKGQTTTTTTSGGQASLTLSGCDATICNARAYYGWGVATKANTEVLTSLPNVASWSTEVVKGVATNVFKIMGVFSITNTGAVAAPIGNIVVNLQTRSGNKWVTIATDASTADFPDLAGKSVTVKVVSGASSENLGQFTTSATASGKLEFNDKDSNTGFALNDKFQLGAGASVNLTYVAAFNNLSPALVAGTAVRAEVIVSFSNAGARGGSGASTASLDITADGKAEANVRSVPCRTTLAVPALETVHDTVTLSDGIAASGELTCADIGLTGVTPPITPPSTCPADLGTVATLSTDTTGIAVTAGVSAGKNEAKLINTAAIASPGLSVAVGDYVFSCVGDFAAQSSAEVVIRVPPPPPTPEPAPQPAPVITYKSYGQGAWHWQSNSSPNSAKREPIATRDAAWSTKYPNGVTVGSKFTMTFTSTAAVDAYLPVKKSTIRKNGVTIVSNGPGALTASVTNPTSTAAGVFGGQVLALKLNVELLGAGGIGGLYVCGDNAFKGKAVSEALKAAEDALGGNGAPDFEKLNALVDWLNGSCGDDKAACTSDAPLPSDSGLSINLSHSPCSP